MLRIIKPYRIVFLLFFAILISCGETFAATRTWSGASTGTLAWTGNWGTDPVAGDDIVITTTGTLIITGIPTLALNSITIHGGSGYTLEFQGTNTLTVGGNAGTDLVIDASTGFVLSATNPPSITMAASATSTINGTYTINSGCTWTMSNANVVNTISTTGSIVNYGTITGATTAKLIFEGNSSYEHKQNGGTIPTADWDGATGTATSTCLVSGMTSTKPGGLITTSNTFYHLTWNCTSQSANVLNSAAGAFTTSGQNMTCLGNFTITSCNGYTMSFSEDSGGSLSTLTVGGNMVISDGKFYFNWWTTPVTANIAGNLNISGGDVYGFNWTSGATTIINISGSVNLSSGWLSGTGSDYSGVTFNITNDLNVTGGGGFNGTWNGAGSPTINIGGDFLVSTAGWYYGASGSGNPIWNITGSMTIAAGGSYYGSDDTGSPTFNITTDLVSSGGWGTGSRSTGIATYNISRDLTVSGGTFYGAYSCSANAVINVTRNLNVSSGWFIGSYGTAAPVITITGSINLSGGDIYLSYSTGSTVMSVATDVNISGGWFGMTYATASPSLTISRDMNLSAGSFGGTESGGACVPTINITRDINQTGGVFYGAYYTGNPAFTIGRDVNVRAGTFYGSDDAGSPTYAITRNFNISGGTVYGTNSSGAPTFTITGNIALTSSGTLKGTGASATASGDPVFNITGNFTASGGSTTFHGSRASGANPTFNIQGSVDLSTGTVSACANYTSTSTTATFNLTGAASNNLTLKTGLTYNTDAAWSWNISAGRTITLLSNVEIGGTGSSCIFTNNGTLIMGTYTFPAIASAVASFVTSSGSTLKTAHLSGLSTTAATGSIQLTGTKTFSSAASYVFNGGGAQVTGNFGASTTPTASTVANLELNNSSGVSLTAGLTVADAGTLTLTSGYHDMGAFTLQLGTSAANSLTVTAGGLYSSTNNGSFKRWIPTGAITSTSANYYGLFPFKKSATNVNVLEFNSTSNVTTAGFITATPGFAQTVLDVVDYADDHGTIQKIKSGKAILVALTTIAGGTFNVQLTSGNFYGGTLSNYALETYTGAATGYTGTFSVTAGSTTVPIVTRTGVSTANLAQNWVVGTYNNSVTPLPIELITFSGQKEGNNNQLNWTTASEQNNDYFTVEKTTDNENFMSVGKVDGAGNSTEIIDYSLVDYDVLPVVNYYRLKQTDFDGKYTFSEVITIDNRKNISSKEIVLITNILGQEVNDSYRGVVIIVYSDVTSIKVIQ